ncbi:hypothetical protein GTA08_BOTSDO01624 [Neofusicoccum parvum]|nr:hypothetical protein GTA08_BOTSDO01624 [Neofusicoccum parvum]
MTVANNTPTTSVDSANPKTVDERQANLPLPDQPPTSSDWQSADARTVNVGSGGVSSDISHGSGATNLHSPAVGGEDITVGRTAKDGLGGLPSDAVARDSRNASGLEETRK